MHKCLDQTPFWNTYEHGAVSDYLEKPPHYENHHNKNNDIGFGLYIMNTRNTLVLDHMIITDPNTVSICITRTQEATQHTGSHDDH